jgi:hypothetical protein
MFQPKLDSRGACAVLQTLLKISGRLRRKIRPVVEKIPPLKNSVKNGGKKMFEKALLGLSKGKIIKKICPISGPF